MNEGGKRKEKLTMTILMMMMLKIITWNDSKNEENERKINKQ